jgi:hypothetical protein
VEILRMGSELLGRLCRRAATGAAHTSSDYQENRNKCVNKKVFR